MPTTIQNIVSIQCNLVAEDKSGAAFPFILRLTDKEISERLSPNQVIALKKLLLRAGVSNPPSRTAQLVNLIETAIHELVYSGNEMPKIRYSDYLREKLNLKYSYMARVFAATKGITLARYIIQHKAERVKELLIFENLSLTEIARRMQYSSVAHLSAQFKKTTGQTTTYFLRNKKELRKQLKKSRSF